MSQCGSGDTRAVCELLLSRSCALTASLARALSAPRWLLTACVRLCVALPSCCTRRRFCHSLSEL